MDEKPEGGAGPALAAHSKDGATPSSNPASEATGNEARGTSDAGASVADRVSNLSAQARDAAGQMASSVADTARGVAEQGGRAADQLIREQPILALAIAGLVGVLAGVLLSRR